MKTIFIALFVLLHTNAHATIIVPPNCVVMSWCVERATECKFMQMLHPNGLYQGESQYSLVRKMKLSCDQGYGRWEEKNLQGPVEAIIYRSQIESEENLARDSSLQLCQNYRSQWLEAAPACQK